MTQPVSLPYAFALSLASALPLWAGEEHAHDKGTEKTPYTKTIEGVASGFDCAVVGVLCPTTHRAADYTTGIFTDESQFYFVVNIPQSFLTQHFLERLEVAGKVYPPYDYALEPEHIRVVKEGEKKLVYDAGYFYDPHGHKALFNQGRVVNGVWLCDTCAKQQP
jgi:hypothetical protein